MQVDLDFCRSTLLVGFQHFSPSRGPKPDQLDNWRALPRSGFADLRRDPMTQHDQQRLVKHRLAVLPHAEEVGRQRRPGCRDCGIGRQTVYAWLHRFEEKGLGGTAG